MTSSKAIQERIVGSGKGEIPRPASLGRMEEQAVVRQNVGIEVIELSFGSEGGHSKHGEENMDKPDAAVEQMTTQAGVGEKVRVESPSDRVLKRPRVEAKTRRPPSPSRVVLEPSARLQEVCDLCNLLF